MNLLQWIKDAARRVSSEDTMTTDYTHPDYDRFAPLWSKVRTCCEGEDAVKAAGETFLPNPSEGPDKFTDVGIARWRRYLARAVYLNASGRTLHGLVGIAYANWPRIVLPAGADYLLNDADGSGTGIINQSQLVVADVLQTGRGGLLADATSTDEANRERSRTLAEAEAAGYRLLLVHYTAEQILTWEVVDRRLSRLVLREGHEEYAGGKVERTVQLRELVMVDGRCEVSLWRQLASQGQFVRVSTTRTGIDRIPFHFVGATNNDPTPDIPPLLDLANLNLHHYQVGADFYESAFLMGQPMLAISGVNDEWTEKVGTIHFGSRAGLPLPTGGSAQLLQVAPNTLAETAMKGIEEKMAMIGARLVTPSATMTATQSASETKAAYSVLSTVCDNVSEAYRGALADLARIYGTDPKRVDFAIDTRFNDLTLDANAIQQTVAAWQAGLVPQSDAWAVLRRLGVVDQGKTDEQLRAEIDAQGPALNLDEAA